MGLLDFIKPKSALEKAAAQVREVYAQPEYRRGAMDKLFELGTAEAYKALLARFTINANGQIADESEKRELVDRLVETGAPVMEPLKTFIKEEKAITFPIRAFKRMVGKEKALSFLIEVLQSYEPLDHRSTHQKITLIPNIADLADASHAAALTPYLQDHNDDVQFQTIVALEKLANEETREAMLEVCTSDEYAARIQRRAAQALVDLGWSAKSHYDRFMDELKVKYLLGKKGQLIKKAAPEEEED